MIYITHPQDILLIHRTKAEKDADSEAEEEEDPKLSKFLGTVSRLYLIFPVFLYFFKATLGYNARNPTPDLVSLTQLLNKVSFSQLQEFVWHSRWLQLGGLYQSFRREKANRVQVIFFY